MQKEKNRQLRLASVEKFLYLCTQMRTWISSILLAVCLMGAHADVLNDIVFNRYKARTLSISEQDSLLNGSPKEPQRYILQYRNQHKMYRHSFTAEWYLYDTKKKIELALSETLVRDACYSPDGRYIVYGKGQDLYIYKVDFHTEVPITHDAADGYDVFSGLSDWLYEEEFSRTRLFEFSPDSRMVAFVRLDETAVPTYSWQMFLGERYPTLRSLRYPKAGDANAKASVCVYDIRTKAIHTMQVPEMDDCYVPRLTWREVPGQKRKKDEPVEYELMVQKINRDQTRMDIYACNPKSTVCRPFYSEQSNRYFVDYALFDQWQWLTDGRVVVLSEKDGWRQAFLYSAQGAQQQVLTPAGTDLTALYGVNEKAGMLYCEAAVVPSERQVFAVSIKPNGGKPVWWALTSEAGCHSLRFSADMNRCIETFQSETMANRYTLYEVRGTQLRLKEVVLTNDSIQQAWEALHMPVKHFMTIPTERGDSLEAWMLLPRDLEQDLAAGKTPQRYPVVMFQYSGPSSQRVIKRWQHRFAHYLASIGYVVVNADPRGTDNRGRAWRNATYMALGNKEAEDHQSVARYMQSLPYVAPDRIAMIGWSYGGYQTIRTMMEPNSLIRCGIAIAPVSDWELYDTGYTERYMRRPQVNDGGYADANLMKRAADLQGRLLLIHGTADDNVHTHNTLLLSDALVKAGKDFDMHLYVDDNHSMLIPENKIHLHNKIIHFLNINL